MHLLSNLYFLLLCGDCVEDYLGPWRWLVLLLAATVTGDMVHLAGDPHSSIPCIGASGGIAGLLDFYALELPRARLGLLLRLYWRFRWLQLPAWAAFGVWLVLQGVGAYLQLAGFSNVSSLAHLGGAGTGFLLWLGWRKLALKPVPAEVRG